MPILDDIMDHAVLGREFRRGFAQGLEQGRAQGLERALHDGESTLLLRQIEKRFGSVPAALRERLKAMSGAGIETVALRVLDARSMEELLR